MAIPGIEEQIANLESVLTFMKSLRDKKEETPTPAVVTPPSVVADPGVKSDFEELKSLFMSDKWPRAVDSALICDENNEDDKLMRAEAIMDQVLVGSLKGQKFLDFGCGQGHVPLRASILGAATSVGYDIDTTNWDKIMQTDNFVLVSTFDKVVERAPYNFILMYDVLDHLYGVSMPDVMMIVKSVLAPDGKIFVRTHPFCSATGTHLYRKVNKAYPHLVFSEEELKILGAGGGLLTAKVIHPLATYRKLFEDAGLAIIQETPIQQSVDTFFDTHHVVAERIKKNWKDSSDPNLSSGKEFPFFQIGLQFVDYLLEVKKP
jgi:2-polyprenyl-3-methyl-5-hydroxy-6-metoxy-1,4-benzoquinol methylase